MCASGVNQANRSNPVKSVLAGPDLQRFMSENKKEKEKNGEQFWELRLGIHTAIQPGRQGDEAEIAGGMFEKVRVTPWGKKRVLFCNFLNKIFFILDTKIFLWYGNRN